VAAAAPAFELVEPQAPLTESLMQEPFVLVSQLHSRSVLVWGHRSSGALLFEQGFGCIGNQSAGVGVLDL
jgi:hypothetical protein